MYILIKILIYMVLWMLFSLISGISLWSWKGLGCLIIIHLLMLFFAYNVQGL